MGNSTQMALLAFGMFAMEKSGILPTILTLSHISYISIRYKLNYNQTSPVSTGKQYFSTFCKLYKFAYLYLSLRLFGNIPHIGQLAVDENPVAIVEMEITYRFLVFRFGSLVGCYKTIYMPHV